MSSAQTFVSCDGGTLPVGDADRDDLYARAARQICTGRFSAGYLVPLDKLPDGMELIPVSTCSDAVRDKPSDSSTTRSSEEFVWAVTAMYESVLPRVAQDDDPERLLSASDNIGGRVGARSGAGAYRWFFGDDAISVELADDGRFWIANGTHRVWVARRLGITHVPARVSRLS